MALVELLFTVVALELKCVLVDPLMDPSHLFVEETLFTTFTFVRSLPSVTDRVASQGGLGRKPLATGGTKIF